MGFSDIQIDALQKQAFQKLARKGHWRTLPSGQSGHDEQGKPVLGKTWVKETIKPGVKLRPYQEGAVEHLDKSPEKGIILAMGTGTGKTVTSVAMAERLRSEGKADRVLVITPAALRTNFLEKGIQKFTTSSAAIGLKPGQVGDETYTVVSIDAFRKNPDAWIDAVQPDILLVDEVHKAKDSDSSTFKSLLKARKRVPYFLGLTGSLVSNKPQEVEPLLDLTRGEKGSLGGKKGFKKRFMRKVRSTRAGIFGGKVDEYQLKNVRRLGKEIRPRTYYVGRKDVKELPRTEEEVVKVPMSPEQKKHFLKAMTGVDPAVRESVLSRVLPSSQKKMMDALTTLRRAREISNSVGMAVPNMPPESAAMKTPKISRTIEDAATHLKETPDGQVIMFTNMVKGGLNYLTAGLSQTDIPFAVFTSKADKRFGDRDQNVKKFLSGDAKIIVVTPAGTEGLDLNTATMFQLLDEHYNPERTQQAIARAVRASSLQHRAPEDRVVQVRRYQSVLPRTFMDKLMRRPAKGGVDEWVAGIAERKTRLNKQLRAVAEGTMQEPPVPGEKSLLSKLFG